MRSHSSSTPSSPSAAWRSDGGSADNSLRPRVSFPAWSPESFASSIAASDLRGLSAVSEDEACDVLEACDVPRTHACLVTSPAEACTHTHSSTSAASSSSGNQSGANGSACCGSKGSRLPGSATSAPASASAETSHSPTLPIPGAESVCRGVIWASGEERFALNRPRSSLAFTPRRCEAGAVGKCDTAHTISLQADRARFWLTCMLFCAWRYLYIEPVYGPSGEKPPPIHAASSVSSESSSLEILKSQCRSLTYLLIWKRH
jgi:hypothetical protein